MIKKVEDDLELISEGNIDNTESSTISENQNVINETNKFSDMIFQLIEHTVKPDVSTELYSGFSDKLTIYLIKLINKRRNLSILNSYFSDTDDTKETDDKNLNSIKYEKVQSKVNKNIMIFLPVLAEYCRMNRKGKNDLEYKNFINQSFKKMLILIFIYGDKTKLSLFSRLLFIDFDTLKEREQLFINNQLFLQSKEIELRKKIQENGEQLTSISDLYTRTYRSVIEKTDEKFLFQNNKNKGNNLNRDDIRNNIAINEINITTKALYELYIKALDLGVNLQETLLEISNAFVLLNGLIESFKYLGIINDGNYKLGSSVKNDKNLFHDFLNINGDNKKLEDFISIIRNNQNKNRLVNKEKSLNNSELDISKLTLKNIVAEDWKIMTSDQKYKFFLEKVLRVGDSSIDLSFFKNRNNKKYLNDFSLKYNYPTDMYLRIINSKNNSRNFSDILNQDIYILIYLFDFFDFVISDGNPVKIDLVSEVLNNKGDNIKTKGDSYNLSAVNIGLQIDFIFKDLSRGNIDLKEFKIGNNLFSDTIKLYSPGEKATLEKSVSYLDNAIDTCIMILNLKKTYTPEQSNYINLLTELGIIPYDLSNIKQLHLDNIIKLIPGLKLVKLKIGVLKKMIEVSKSDTDNVSNIFSKVGLKSGSSTSDFRLTNSIGPEKDFGRIVIKLIKEYTGDFHKIGDLNRFKLVGTLCQNSEDNILNKISLLSSLNSSNNGIITFQNYLGHLFGQPEKKAGYRGINANLMLPSGNIVEIQIHITEMLLAKSGNAQIDKQFRDILDKHGNLLNSEEVDDLVRLYFDLFNKYLPRETIINLSTKLSEDINEKNTGDGILNCDILYKINRYLDAKNPLKEKLTKLERTLFDFYWSKVVLLKVRSLGIEYK